MSSSKKRKAFNHSVNIAIQPSQISFAVVGMRTPDKKEWEVVGIKSALQHVKSPIMLGLLGKGHKDIKVEMRGGREAISKKLIELMLKKCCRVFLIVKDTATEEEEILSCAMTELIANPLLN